MSVLNPFSFTCIQSYVNGALTIKMACPALLLLANMFYQIKATCRRIGNKETNGNQINAYYLTGLSWKMQTDKNYSNSLVTEGLEINTPQCVPAA